MNTDLMGRNIIVTGASRGIGRVVARCIAASGGTVLGCYRSDTGAADSALEDLRSAGGGRHRLDQVDVASPEAVAAYFIGLEEEGTVVHGLVNNAALISQRPLQAMDIDEWRAVLDSSLTGAFLMTQGAARSMTEGGSVVNVSSRISVVGVPAHAHYAAAKAGLAGLTRSLCKELGPAGIRVNQIVLGVIETEAAEEHLSPERRDYYNRMTSLGRIGRSEEVAGVIGFLLGSCSSYVTGASIAIDGGM